MPELAANNCRVAVIWIDWYAYHVARFRGLLSVPALHGQTVGIEMVGGIGVHAGLKFREELPVDLPIETMMPNVAWRDANKWKLSAMLWKRLSELKPEVVLVPGYYTLPGIAIALWARIHGATSVLMTESTSGDHQRTAWKEWLKGLGMRMLFDWAVAGGKAHLDYLAELGFPSSRVSGGYDVVDNRMFEAGTDALRNGSPAAYGLPESKYFLYVGRLAEEKNVMGLLESWLEYRRAGGLWPLVLVGDGPEAKALRATAEASEFGDAVFFPGLKSSRELLPFYAFAGCFVLPSTREPWGLVVNEAMASGQPVLVSTACGCGPDLVSEGLNGFRFIPADKAALTGLLRHVANLPSEELERMGRCSKQIICNYSPEHFGRSVALIGRKREAGNSLEASYGGNV
jgi:glycosyltransferase involved in cell wall biosynthesis